MAEAVTILMEASPSGIDLRKAIEKLESLKNVNDVHHVHAWTLTSNVHIFSAHLHVSEGVSAQDVLHEANYILRNNFGFHLSTLQVETACLDEDHAKSLDFLNVDAVTQQHSVHKNIPDQL